jgi:hypothetical protein
VLVQYCAKLNAEKLAKVVHGLLPEAQRLGKKKSFNFRVANEDVGCALAGFRVSCLDDEDSDDDDGEDDAAPACSTCTCFFCLL